MTSVNPRKRADMSDEEYLQSKERQKASASKCYLKYVSPSWDACFVCSSPSLIFYRRRLQILEKADTKRWRCVPTLCAGVYVGLLLTELMWQKITMLTGLGQLTALVNITCVLELTRRVFDTVTCTNTFAMLDVPMFQNCYYIFQCSMYRCLVPMFH